MASIADIFFSARLEDGGLQTDAKRAGDKAGLTLGKRMTGGFKSASTGLFAGLGVAGGLAAFSAIDTAVSATIGFLSDAKDAALEEERSIAKLGAALKANIKDWDGNTDAIEDALAARMRLGFADDEQRSSLAVLVSVTKDHTKALELQRLAMDLARLRGIDLAAASDIVGKVYGGNIGILSRYGIQLKKGIAPAEALAEVQRRAAGQAEAYAKTNEGKLLASQIKVGEAMEKLGAKILPLVADAMLFLADTIGPVIEGIAQAVDVIQETVEAYNLFKRALESGMTPQQRLQQDAIDAAMAIHAEQQALIEAAGGFDKWAEAQLGAIETTEDLADATSGLIGKLADDLDLGAITAGAEAMRRQVGEAAAGMAQDLAANGANLATVSAELAANLPNAVRDNRAEVRRQAVLSMVDYAAGLRDKRGQITAAIELLNTDIDNALSRRAEANQLLAQLGGENIAKGLASADPVVRAQAQGTVQLISDRLAELSVDASEQGGQAGANYAEAMKDTAPLAETAANTLTNSAEGPMRDTKDDAYTFGRNAGQNFASGLSSKQVAVEQAAARLAGAVGNFLKVSSPAKMGPMSLGGGPEGWGETAILTLAEGMRRHISDVVGAARDVAGGVASGLALSPAIPRYSLGSAVSVPSAGRIATPSFAAVAPGPVTRINNITVPITGLLKGRDPFEVADRLRRFADNGAFDPPEEYS